MPNSDTFARNSTICAPSHFLGRAWFAQCLYGPAAWCVVARGVIDFAMCTLRQTACTVCILHTTQQWCLPSGTQRWCLPSAARRECLSWGAQRGCMPRKHTRTPHRHCDGIHPHRVVCKICAVHAVWRRVRSANSKPTALSLNKGTDPYLHCTRHLGVDTRVQL